jgi:hypothetical protein
MVKPQSPTMNDLPVPGLHDDDVDAFRRWADGLVGLPISTLTRSDVGPMLSGRAWLDSAFDACAALLTVQRQSVDRLLAAQHRIAAELVDAAWARTTAISGLALPKRSEDARR